MQQLFLDIPDEPIAKKRKIKLPRVLIEISDAFPSPCVFSSKNGEITCQWNHVFIKTKWDGENGQGIFANGKIHWQGLVRQTDPLPTLDFSFPMNIPKDFPDSDFLKWSKSAILTQNANWEMYSKDPMFSFPVHPTAILKIIGINSLFFSNQEMACFRNAATTIILQGKQEKMPPIEYPSFSSKIQSFPHLPNEPAILHLHENTLNISLNSLLCRVDLAENFLGTKIASIPNAACLNFLQNKPCKIAVSGKFILLENSTTGVIL